MFKRLLLLALLPLTACQTAATDPDLAVRVFDQLAYRGTAGGHPNSLQLMLETSYEKGRMFLWQKPIWVSVRRDAATEDEIARIKEIMDELGAVAGLKINYMDPIDAYGAGNFRFEFLDAANLFINKSEFASCAARVKRLPSGGIDFVEVQVAREAKISSKRCLYHEVLHGFGMAHTTLVPSVMNYGSEASAPTKWDIMVLRTMYSDIFAAGMTREDSLHLARRAVRLSQE